MSGRRMGQLQSFSSGMKLGSVKNEGRSQENEDNETLGMGNADARKALDTAQVLSVLRDW